MEIAFAPLVRETAGLIVGLLIVRTVIKAPVSQLLRCLLPIIFSVVVMGLLIEAARPAVVENFGQPGSLFICILLASYAYFWACSPMLHRYSLRHDSAFCAPWPSCVNSGENHG
jgi:hypothetical protein